MKINNDSFSDSINIAGLILGLMNLEENLTQNDKQDLIDKFNQEANHLLSETHQHLQSQDEKMDLIIKQLESQEQLLRELIKNNN